MALITSYILNYGVLIRSGVLNAIDVKTNSNKKWGIHDVNVTTIEYFNYLL